MLLTSKNFVKIPKQTTKAIEVNVPVNPASLINVQPLDEELLDGALPVVYRHKTQQKDKSLVIMYANLSDKDVIISPNQLIAHGSMISESLTNQHLAKPPCDSSKLLRFKHCSKLREQRRRPLPIFYTVSRLSSVQQQQPGAIIPEPFSSRRRTTG